MQTIIIKWKPFYGGNYYQSMHEGYPKLTFIFALNLHFINDQRIKKNRVAKRNHGPKEGSQSMLKEPVDTWEGQPPNQKDH